jgi:UDP-glucose 4-epimerase
MIAIVNIGGGDAKDILGVRDYELRINHEVITTFKHRRSEGLSKCLFEASKAAERVQWEQVNDFLNKL